MKSWTLWLAFSGAAASLPLQETVEPPADQGTRQEARHRQSWQGDGGAAWQGSYDRIRPAPRRSGLLELAAKLKQRCGTGGTVKDGRIEIQGDQRERLVVELERLGYKAKRVGG